MGGGGGRGAGAGAGALPLLPLMDRALLPATVARVSLPADRPGSAALVEHLMARPKGEMFVAAVPAISAPTMERMERDQGVTRADLPLLCPPPAGRPAAAGRPPLPEALCRVGTVARVVQVGRLGGDAAEPAVFKLVLEGLRSVSLEGVEALGRMWTAVPSSGPDAVPRELPAGAEGEHAAERLRQAVGELTARLQHVSPSSDMARLGRALQSTTPMQACDMLVAGLLPPRLWHQLQCLALTDPLQRVRVAVSLVEGALQGLGPSRPPTSGVLVLSGKAGRDEAAKSPGGGLLKPSDYVALRQRIRRHPQGPPEGGDDEDDDSLGMLEKKIKDAKPPRAVLKAGLKEIRRLKRSSEQQPGYASARAYVECLADLPWSRTQNVAGGSQRTALALRRARQELDEAHYGLDKVKERIIQYIAVQRLRRDVKGPVLCFVGPPGVGKTSLARSVASVLGRPLQRVALGGVRDEAEIRGHRRTYIGSMPGRIIQALRRAQVKDPLLLLDEMDKTGRDGIRGDPSSALLEVLDPEQNHSFIDHYVGHAFNLSSVMFVGTANRLADIPGPLRDRLEVIEVSGYTLEEKVHIAERHLVPRLLAEHGLSPEQLAFPRSALENIVSGYTREAGVRDLERHLAAICRTCAVDVALATEDRAGPALQEAAAAPSGAEEELGPASPLQMSQGEAVRMVVDEEMVEQVLGLQRFEGSEQAEQITMPGVVLGLVWTSVGGAVQFIECCRASEPEKPEKGRASGGSSRNRLILTGSLGEVLEESVQIALSWVKANAANLKFANSLEGDIHVHLPSGAVPKDGPSAGVTVSVALASMFMNRLVRSDTAMTGEVTLQGLVLPVGGVKEKVLAAHRAGVKRVLLPSRNVKDALSEVPKEVLKQMTIIPLERVEDAIREGLVDGSNAWAPASRL